MEFVAADLAAVEEREGFIAMLDDTLLWSYWNVWRPFVHAQAQPNAASGEPEAASGARQAFDKVMSKARAGATPPWWAVTDRVGHA